MLNRDVATFTYYSYLLIKIYSFTKLLPLIALQGRAALVHEVTSLNKLTVTQTSQAQIKLLNEFKNFNVALF